jgi:putative membrane protein
MRSPLTQLLLRWVVLALGVILATKLIPGIRYDDGSSLVAVVLLLSLFNAVLKPLIVLFTLPFIVLTMGLGVVVINALLFLFVGRLVDGFHVAGFWSAVGGAVIVSVTNMLLSGLTKPPKPPRAPEPPREARRADKGDVIDI